MKYRVLIVQATEISASQRFQPPKTVGNSIASTASGPVINTEGITANIANWWVTPYSPCLRFGLVEDSSSLSPCPPVSLSALTSGPIPGFSFLSTSGGSFLFAIASVTVCFISSVVPLNVRRRYGSKWLKLQRTLSSSFSPRNRNQVPFV